MERSRRSAAMVPMVMAGITSSTMTLKLPNSPWTIISVTLASGMPIPPCTATLMIIIEKNKPASRVNATSTIQPITLEK